MICYLLFLLGLDDLVVKNVLYVSLTVCFVASVGLVVAVDVGLACWHYSCGRSWLY